MPWRDRRPRACAGRPAAPSIRSRPLSALVGAEQQAGDLGAAGAEQPGQADDLALVDGQVERLDRRPCGPARRPATNGCRAPTSARARWAAPPAAPGRRAPGRSSCATRSTWLQLGGGVLADQAAVAQHRHPVGRSRRPGRGSGDEQDRDALVLELPHHPEQLRDLARVEAGGRLVEDQHLGRRCRRPARWRPSAGRRASRSPAAPRRRCRGRAAPSSSRGPAAHLLPVDRGRAGAARGR